MKSEVQCPKCGSDDTLVSIPMILGCSRYISCAGIVLLMSLTLMLPFVLKDLDDINVRAGLMMWGLVFVGMITLQLPVARLSRPFMTASCQNPLCRFSWKLYRMTFKGS